MQLAFALVCVCSFLAGVQGQLYRGARFAWTRSVVPRLNDSTQATLTNLTTRFPVFQRAPPVWPSVRTDLVTVYLTLDEAAGFQAAYLQCALLCVLYNGLGSAPVCGGVQVETRGCHAVTAKDRRPGDSSVVGHTWCTFLLAGVPGAGDYGTRTGTLPLDTSGVTECVGSGVVTGSGCTPEGTLLVPDVAQAAFWRWAFGWTARGGCVPLLTRVQAAILWTATLGPGCPPTGPCASWDAVVDALGVSQEEAWMNLPCTPRETPLVPGACYCNATGGYGGPTCSLLVPGCNGCAVPAVPGVPVSHWVSTGTPVFGTLGQPVVAAPLCDGSWAGADAPGDLACAPGGCLSTATEGPQCNLARCSGRVDTGLRCGGESIGACTTAYEGGCECNPGTWRDPRTRCASCLSTHVAVADSGSDSDSPEFVCVPVAAACFAGTGTPPWAPRVPCSGHGNCAFLGPSKVQVQCVCLPGWSGPLCDTGAAEVTGVPGVCAAAEALGAACKRALWSRQASALEEYTTRVVHLVGPSAAGDASAAEGTCLALGGRVAASALALDPVSESFFSAENVNGWVRNEGTGSLEYSRVDVSPWVPLGVFCEVPTCHLGPGASAFPRAWGTGAAIVHMDLSSARGATLGGLLSGAAGGSSAQVDAACGGGGRVEARLGLGPVDGEDDAMWYGFLWSASWLGVGDGGGDAPRGLAQVLGLGNVTGVDPGADYDTRALYLVTALVAGERRVWRVMGMDDPGHASLQRLSREAVAPLAVTQVVVLGVLCTLPEMPLETMATLQPRALVLDTRVRT